MLVTKKNEEGSLSARETDLKDRITAKLETWTLCSWLQVKYPLRIC